MLTTSILALHDGYIASIDANRRLALESVDEEAFHDLRVATKRERALLRYVEAIGVDLDAKKSFRIFRSLFRAAGAVRDIHIQQGVARRLAPRGAREHQRLLRAQLDEALWAFSRTRPPAADALTALRSRIENALSRVDETLAAPVIEAHLRALERDVDRLKRERGALHELRIAIKNALYTMHFIETSCATIPIAKEREAQMHRLQRLLGNWHDLEISLAMNESLGAPLEEAIRSEKEKLRRRVRYVLRTLL